MCPILLANLDCENTQAICYVWMYDTLVLWKQTIKDVGLQVPTESFPSKLSKELQLSSVCGLKTKMKNTEVVFAYRTKYFYGNPNKLRYKITIYKSCSPTVWVDTQDTKYFVKNI